MKDNKSLIRIISGFLMSMLLLCLSCKNSANTDQNKQREEYRSNSVGNSSQNSQQPTPDSSNETKKEDTITIPPLTIDPQDPPLIIYHQEGGFFGGWNRWEIFSDGRVTLNLIDGSKKKYTIKSEEVTKLHTSIKNLNFFKLENKYLTQYPCSDCSLYKISLHKTNNDYHHVQTDSFVFIERSPENLSKIIELLEDFMRGFNPRP